MSFRVRVIVRVPAYSGHTWPAQFHAVPRKGEYIESREGARLRVVKVTHLHADTANRLKNATAPLVEVELGTKRKR